MTFHQLRGSCASIMRALGVAQADVADQLGHSDERLTRKVYITPMPESRHRASAAMNALLAQVPRGDAE